MVKIAKQKIAPCLWFDSQAEEAAKFYTSIFKNSKILNVARYGESGARASGRPKGSVMTVEFQLEGQEFVALNGGPLFKFSEAISFMIYCKDQKELDYFWTKLTAGGQEGQCGWLKDKFGLSWQVVPAAMDGMLRTKDAKKTERVMAALINMKKLDIKKLEQVYEGK